MRTLGLTGGIGSGKSTVAALLAARGAVVVDADALSRATTAVGGAAIAPIAAAFGAEFIDATGALDRERMRQRVFADPTARRRLEALVHPLVRRAIEARVAEVQAAGARCAVLDIPLLVESRDWPRRLDRVLVVDCTAETQVARVMARNGLEQAAVLRIVASQASRSERRAAADAVLFNDGCTLEQLASAVSRTADGLGL